LNGIGYCQLPHYIWRAQEAGDEMRFVDDIPATYHPHNTIIGLLGENGLLLTVPFLVLAGCFFKYLRGCIRFARSAADNEFGYFAGGAAFALLAPHMTDRCLCWNKYNLLLFLFFALVAVHHQVVMGRVRRSGARESGTQQAGQAVLHDAAPLSPRIA
jgi:hypothetical protein